LRVEAKPIKGGRWKIIQLPIADHDYVMGCDTASGKMGGNESVACILDVNTGVQVAILAGQIIPRDFAVESEKAGYFYNEAWIGVEMEFHGATVVDYLRGRGYPNIYFHSQNITAFQGGANQYGWDSRRYRQTAIDWLQQDVGWSKSGVADERKRAVYVKNPDTISQMGYFIRNKKTGKFEGASGKLDDKVSALYIANSLRREKYTDIFRPTPPPERKKTFAEEYVESITTPYQVMDDRDLGGRDIGYE
jgi:hypothetical protein